MADCIGTGCKRDALQAENEKLRATLAMVADIAHSGGLVLHSDFTALTAIRRLTLEAWNQHGTEAEHRKRVNDACREAVRRCWPLPWPEPSGMASRRASGECMRADGPNPSQGA